MHYLRILSIENEERKKSRTIDEMHKTLLNVSTKGNQLPPSTIMQGHKTNHNNLPVERLQRSSQP